MARVSKAAVQKAAVPERVEPIDRMEHVEPDGLIVCVDRYQDQWSAMVSFADRKGEVAAVRPTREAAIASLDAVLEVAREKKR